MTDASRSLHALDSAYRAFPAFAEWAARTIIDDVRWNRYVAELGQPTRQVDQVALRNAHEMVKRAAAVDTGAIEGFYEVDRGFTFTVALGAAVWESWMAVGSPGTELEFAL